MSNEQEILQQIQLFLQSAFVGVRMFFCYDLLRIFRRFCPHNTLWMGVEDLAFWIFGACAVFLFLYETNQGEIRIHFILGWCLGWILYEVGCSPWVLKVGKRRKRH